MDTTFNNLIRGIKEKSRKGLIAWSPSSFDNVYQADLGKGAIMIMFVDEDHQPPVNLEILRSSPIASLSFVNERGEVFNSINCYLSQDEYYDDLKEIYESSHNTYMKIDETLQSMLDDLNGRK